LPRPSLRGSCARARGCRSENRGGYWGCSSGKTLSEKRVPSRAFYFLDNVGGFVVRRESAQAVLIQQLTLAGAPTQVVGGQ